MDIVEKNTKGTNNNTAQMTKEIPSKSQNAKEDKEASRRDTTIQKAKNEHEKTFDLYKNVTHKTKTAKSEKTHSRHQKKKAFTAAPMIFGRKGDPRMNKAVARRLDNPGLSLIDALLIGGFSFPDGVNKPDRSVYDSDGVRLGQRKNQLIRRLRLLRKGKVKSFNLTKMANSKKANRETSKSYHRFPTHDTSEMVTKTNTLSRGHRTQCRMQHLFLQNHQYQQYYKKSHMPMMPLSNMEMRNKFKDSRKCNAQTSSAYTHFPINNTISSWVEEDDLSPQLIGSSSSNRMCEPLNHSSSNMMYHQARAALTASIKARKKLLDHEVVLKQQLSLLPSSSLPAFPVTTTDERVCSFHSLPEERVPIPSFLHHYKFPGNSSLML